jgi:hypothetical protein
MEGGGGFFRGRTNTLAYAGAENAKELRQSSASWLPASR